MRISRRILIGALAVGLLIPVGSSAQERGAPQARDPVPRTPGEGGPRTFAVTGVSTALRLRDSPSTSGRVLGGYPAGTLLTNLGCRRSEGRVWCDVQEVRGGFRGFVAADYLEPAVSPDGWAAYGPDDSALRAGQGEFDATGRIPCAREAGHPMGECEFGVSRAGGGYATVVITHSDGRTRAIYFHMGIAIGADTSEADPGAFSVTRESDLNLIRVGSARYEIPDAVVSGG